MPKKLKILKDMYGELCLYCYTNIATTIDHIIPISRYGTDALPNLLPACKKCNSQKSYSSIYQFCSESVLLRIDTYRKINKFILLSQYSLEQDLPIERRCSKKSSLRTQQKLRKLPFTRRKQILMSCYLYNKIHETDKAKRIISLIYQSEYSQAINKIKEYNVVIPVYYAIKQYCKNKEYFDHYVSELINFFNNKRNYEIQYIKAEDQYMPEKITQAIINEL